MFRYDVSVIFAMYNPQWDKILCTLNSIIVQKKVRFEIVFCDDASKIDLSSEIEEYLVNKGFSDYKFVRHKENVGTVNNLYDGILECEGKYCVGTSPGDMIYDDSTVSDFFDFCEKNDLSICFGNAVYYNVDSKPTIINNILNQPQDPTLFENQSINEKLIALFFNIWINGTTYFRRTDVAKNLIGEIKDIVKYVEDTPSSLLALAKGIDIRYFDRKISWYEYGTGISTNKISKWDEVMKKDIKAAYNYLKTEYPNNNVIDAAYFTLNHGKVLSILYRIIKHPIILYKVIQNKKRKQFVAYDISDLDKLNYMLGNCCDRNYKGAQT